MCGVVIRHI